VAAKEKISLSLKIRDLIKDALEVQEDILLAEDAAEREKSFRRRFNKKYRLRPDHS
jgi:mRNA-degrading endonuclease RelE of RelBE toxin-antitoxin system